MHRASISKCIAQVYHSRCELTRLRTCFLSFLALCFPVVEIIMLTAPIGICSLIISKLGEDGDFWAKISQLGIFMATVVLGLVVHTFIVLPVIYVIFARKNPYSFIAGLGQALTIALGTSSSTATLPVTIRNLEENNGLSHHITTFMLPLGATLNMNGELGWSWTLRGLAVARGKEEGEGGGGISRLTLLCVTSTGTALYEGCAALFIAQAAGIELTIGQTLIVSFTSAVGVCLCSYVRTVCEICV
jgi:Na+/H+-dicarboxylate symporter